MSEHSEITLPAPYRESVTATLRRTLAIAVVVGTILALAAPSGIPRWKAWPASFFGVLWFSLGGHFVELIYLNGLRSRIRLGALAVPVRLLVWLVGGTALFAGMAATFRAFGSRIVEPIPWWGGGIFFILVECVVHTILWIGRKINER